MKRENLDNVAVFIIWLVAALWVTLFLLISSEASASQTMHLVDSYVDGGQRVCVYSDGRDYAYTYRARGSNCPFTHIEY